MNLVGIYLVTLIPFLLIDLVGLRMLMLPLFERHVGAIMVEDVKVGVAGAFYLCYVAGILYFAIIPGAQADNAALVIMNGAILGLLAYGTYEATNMATLRGWSWSMVVVDVTWGAILTATTAYIGYFISKHILGLI